MISKRFNVQNIPRFYNKAPAGPNSTRGGEGQVLRQGEVFNWTPKVTDTGDNDRPLFKATVGSQLATSTLLLQLFQKSRIWPL